MTELENVLQYLPLTIKQKIEMIFLNEGVSPNSRKKGPSPNYPNYHNCEEIRLRANKPLILKTGQESQIIDHIVKQEEILQAFERICENSVYSYRRQICDGYITIRGGNRVGIVGSAVVDNGQVININYISSLNFRIARQKIGCSDSIIKDIIDFSNQTIYNTLIISPPRLWKNYIIKGYYKKYKQWNKHNWIQRENNWGSRRKRRNCSNV